MKPLLLFSLLLSSFPLFAQHDTVFVRKNTGWANDTLKYETDTLLFGSGSTRNFLAGTMVLPSTHNQMNARGYGLFLSKVTKSNCQGNSKSGQDKINSILRTDSTLTIDITIYDNCCYDFLCDIAVDSSSVLNIIYHGYGTYCGCECCFGITYHFTLEHLPEYGEIKAAMINGYYKSLKKIGK